MPTGCDWKDFNNAWRKPICERQLNRTLKVTIWAINKTVSWINRAPTKFWWGIFFGYLIGVLLLAPESNFSNRFRDFFYSIQYGAVDIFDGIAGMLNQSQLLVAFTVLIVFVIFIKITDINRIFNSQIDRELERIKSLTSEERHLEISKKIDESSGSSSSLAIVLTIVSIVLSYLPNPVG